MKELKTELMTYNQIYQELSAVNNNRILIDGGVYYSKYVIRRDVIIELVQND